MTQDNSEEQWGETMGRNNGEKQWGETMTNELWKMIQPLKRGSRGQMRTRVVAALVAMLLSHLTTAGGSERDAHTRSEICAFEQKTNRAIIERDTTFISALLADEYQHTNFIGGITDKTAELAFFSSPEFALNKASIDSCNVHVYHEVAVATGVNNWTEAHYGNRNLSGLYRYTTVYVYRGGRWQIVAGHASKVVASE
jgi:hypothetical protein